MVEPKDHHGNSVVIFLCLIPNNLPIDLPNDLPVAFHEPQYV